MCYRLRPVEKVNDSGASRQRKVEELLHRASEGDKYCE